MDTDMDGLAVGMTQQYSFTLLRHLSRIELVYSPKPNVILHSLLLVLILMQILTLSCAM